MSKTSRSILNICLDRVQNIFYQQKESNKDPSATPLGSYSLRVGSGHGHGRVPSDDQNAFVPVERVYSVNT